MNKFFTWLFFSDEYTGIVSAFETIVLQHKEAYQLWCSERGEASSSSWSHQKLVSENFEKIKKISQDFQIYDQLSKKYSLGLNCLSRDRLLGCVQKYSSSYYSMVVQRREEIMKLESIISLFSRYPNVWKLLGIGELEKASSSTLRDTYSLLQKHGSEASEISQAIKLSELYPLSWRVFHVDDEKEFDCECVTRACEIPQEVWSKKERFLKKTRNKQGLVRIILGQRTYNESSFSPETLEIEDSILKELVSPSLDCLNNFDLTLTDGEDQIKLWRLILNYKEYGESINFGLVDVSVIYCYAFDLVKNNCRFVDLVQAVKANREAITAYKRSRGLEDEILKEDYISMGIEDSELYRYVFEYTQMTELRDQVSTMQEKYPLGFNSLLGKLNLHEASLKDLKGILLRESEIKEKEIGLLTERARVEEEKRERKRQEQIQKQRLAKLQEHNLLKECVSSWYTPRKANVKCFSLYNYYPTTCDWDVDSRAWDIRRLIWNFKANPNKPTSISEVERLHREAVESIVPKIRQCLNHFFGDYIEKLTLVCIPSSKQVVTERRYKDFSSKLCRQTGMTNGYDYIEVVQDGGAKHLGQKERAICFIDPEFFKGKYVLIFDDVITSGSSMNVVAEVLQIKGATVIGGLSIGITKHREELDHPIDSLNIRDDMPISETASLLELAKYMQQINRLF